MKTEKTKINARSQRALCIATDWFTTFLAFLCFNVFRFFYMNLGDEFHELGAYLLSPKLVVEQIVVPVMLLLVYWLSGYYNRPLERSRLNEFLVTFYSQLFNSIVIYLAALTNDQLYLRRENWMLIIILFLLLFSFTYIGRLMVTDRLMKRMRRINLRPRTAMIGMSKDAMQLASKLLSQEKNGIDLVALMPFGREKLYSEEILFPDVKLLENIDQLKELCSKKEIDQIILVPGAGKSPTKKILFFLYNLYPFDISIKINPDIYSLITPTIRLEDILGEPFVDLTRPQISEFSKNIKRTIDVVAALTGLILFSPLFAIVSLGIRLSGPGDIIYSQERIGLHRKPFKILKFRSMIPEAEKDGIPLLSSDHDARITKMGKWMRKYRIDELPQFWNVLKGEMSLVGPRPEREFFIEKIINKAPWYTLVLQVRPGITSWGMVKYGYATEVEEMIERNRYDLIYLSNMSVAVDFKILIHTVKTVGSGEGK